MAITGWGVGGVLQLLHTLIVTVWMIGLMLSRPRARAACPGKENSVVHMQVA